MKDLKKIFSEHIYFIYFLVGYFLFRAFILNINYTEWGDTFRMIRGAEYLADFSWPWDEKRWPFYSLLLVPGIWLGDPITWGRVLSIFISSLSAVYIYKFYLRYLSDNKLTALIAAIFVLSSSVFAYWSIRVMADPVFALMVLVFFYYFPKNYFNWTVTKKVALSILLLAITMTRLEGLFVAASVAYYLKYINLSGDHIMFKLKPILSNLRRRLRDWVILFTPQALIYLPWTVYAKILYKGEVANDYLDEVQTFVFNVERFTYFFTYTLFILVIPITVLFVFNALNKIKNEKPFPGFFIPIAIFVALELLIGFVWTPSLPRIYMPVIPFLGMLTIYGVEIASRSKLQEKSFFIWSIVLVLLFALFQYEYKLYFLGASKILFAFIMLMSLLMIAHMRVEGGRRLLFVLLILTNLLISAIIVANQSQVYTSVKKAIEYLQTTSGVVAYSDETGNTSWYMRDRGYYLNPEISYEDFDKQYSDLKDSGADYLLWTDEFNRGSRYLDPKTDPRYQLVYIYSQPIRDPLDIIADKVGLFDDTEFTTFTTKVYKVN